MQWINRDILNPLFIIIFSGTGLLSLLNICVLLFSSGSYNFFVAASAGYVIGVFLITILGNVPMNNKLDALKPESGEYYWKTYLSRWTLFNHIRTTVGAVSLFLFIIGFVQL